MTVVETTSFESEGSELSGVDKAAIVLLELGVERSSQIMKLLGEAEAAKIGAAIARSGTISRADAERSMQEFAALARSGNAPTMGGLIRAREVLVAAVGAERADAIMATVAAEQAPKPFEFLLNVEESQLVNFLAAEHPQTIAVVIAHLDVEIGAQVVAGLPESVRQEVTVRLAKLERLSGQVVDQLVEVLAGRFSTGKTEARQVEGTDGVQRLIDILNRTDRATERSIFEALESNESELADRVRGLMFVFEDIVDLDDRSVQLVLRNVDNGLLAKALKGTKNEVRDKVTTNMSERASQNLMEQVDLLGQVRRSEAEEAQAAVVQVIRDLEEAGELELSRDSEDFVE